MDLAPADSMLITHHRDRPGTMGRIGVAARRGGRQHQRDDARPLRAARRRVHGPRARRRRARRRSWRRSAADDAVIDVWIDPPGRRAVTAGRRRPARTRRSSPRASTRRSSCSATASPSGSVESRFQGQAETPLSDDGPPAGGARRRAARAPARLAGAAGPRAAGRSRSSTRRSRARPRPRGRGGRDRRGGDRGDGGPGVTSGRSPGSSRSARASGRA